MSVSTCGGLIHGGGAYIRGGGLIVGGLRYNDRFRSCLDQHLVCSWNHPLPLEMLVQDSLLLRNQIMPMMRNL